MLLPGFIFGDILSLSERKKQGQDENLLISVLALLSYIAHKVTCYMTSATTAVFTKFSRSIQCLLDIFNF